MKKITYLRGECEFGKITLLTSCTGNGDYHVSMDITKNDKNQMTIEYKHTFACVNLTKSMLIIGNYDNLFKTKIKEVYKIEYED